MSTALISDFATGVRFTPTRYAASATVREPGLSSPPLRSARAGSPRSHLRLTRRGRLAVTILVALPIIAGTSAVILTGASAVATQSSTSAAFEYVQVESGQSLWQLAAAVAPDSDPREVVSDIVHLNQLQSTDVQPGQRLAIPLEYTR